MNETEQRLNYYKELYYKEVERRKDFNNAIIIPITLLTGFVSILFFIVSTYNFNLDKTWSIFFLITLSLSFVLFLYSTYFTLKFYSNVDTGYKTIELPSPIKIEDYRIKLFSFHKQYDEYNTKFLNWLIEEYIKVADSYQDSNDKKAKYFFNFKKYFTYGLLSLILCGITFEQNYISSKKNLETINISINLITNDTIKEVKNISLNKKDTLKFTLKEKSNGKK